MTTFPIEAEGDADLTGFIAAFTAATAVLSSFAGVAGAASVAGAALAATGLIPAVNAAGDFQAEMIRLNTLADVSEEKIQELTEAVLDLAPALGQTPSDLTRGLYAIVSAGERTDNVLELMTQSAKAARLGLGDIEDIARVGAAALQAFRHDGITATEAIDILLTTVREGAAEAEDLPIALGRVIGIAGQMGVTFQEVGTFMATFTRLGVSAEVAATSLRAALFAILNPGAEAQKTFRDIGLSVEEMRRAIEEDGLTEAMLMLLRRTEGNDQALANIIPNIRAMAGVLGVYAAQTESVVAIQDKFTNNLASTDEEFESIQGTFENLKAEFVAGVTTLGTSIGTYFLPPASEMVNIINSIIGAAEAGGDAILGLAVDIGKFGADVAGTMAGVQEDATRTAEQVAGIAGELQGLSNEQLEDLKRQAEDQLGFFGDQQKTGNADPEIMRRFNVAYELNKKINEEMVRRQSLTSIELEGFLVIAGATEDQREATERLLQTLEDRLLREQDLEEQIIRNKLATNDATSAEIERAVQLIRQIKALEEAKEEERKLARQREENENALLRIRRQNINSAVRGALAEHNRRVAEEQERARIITEIEIERISQAMERQARFVESVSGDIVDSLGDVITRTKDVGQAFADMVTRIIQEFTRLRLEQGLTRILNRLFISIPNTPAPIPDPQVSIEGVTIPAAGGDFILPQPGVVSNLQSPSFVVEQNINFQVSAVDSRDMRRALQENSDTIAGIVGNAVQNSVSYARRLRGRGGG